MYMFIKWELLLDLLYTLCSGGIWWISTYHQKISAKKASEAEIFENSHFMYRYIKWEIANSFAILHFHEFSISFSGVSHLKPPIQ